MCIFVENKKIQYKQAIIIGAAPIEEEKKQLLSLLQWGGYGVKEVKQTECNHDCSGCKKSCEANEIEKDMYVIAADGGYEFLAKNDLQPDYWIGDCDSLLEYKDKIKQLPHEEFPVEKDDTDMALAVKKAFDMGYREIMIFGGCGGKRVSHTLANIQLMKSYAKKDCNIRMMGNGIRMEMLVNGKKAFSRALKGSVSVICLSDLAKNVKIKGLKYEYEGDLSSDVPLGVSNSFVGKDASIEVESGDLLIIYEKE